MKKIPTIFERNWDGDRSRVTGKPHPDCGWVFAGEGTATIKLPGSGCMVRDGVLYKRREIKPGTKTPKGFELVDSDEKTGKTIGWVEVGPGPEDRWHREAWLNASGYLPDGNYELLGPKVEGNEDGHDQHVLIAHGSECPETPVVRTFEGIREWLQANPSREGLVFHHPDGRRGKIKLRDFGIAHIPRAR